MLREEFLFHTLITLLVLLVLVFLFLLGYTFWTRQKHKYWNRYEEKFRDYFMPMLFSFVEGEPDISDADKIINKLTKRTEDLAFFLELLDELAGLLKGEDNKKLDLLIEHPMFYSFYKDKLFSYSQKDKMLACVYFENVSTLEDRISARLVTLSRSRNLKLAYAATKALQASDNIITRRNALISFLRRKDITELMVSELLHYFYRDEYEQQKVIASALKDILLESKISSDKKRVIVLFFAHQNLFETGDFLLQYLQKLQYSAQKSPLIGGIIETLGRLHITEAAPIIRQYMKIDDIELRRECVDALGNLGGEDNLAFLMKMILRVEFTVKKEIIRTLVRESDYGLNYIYQFLHANKRFVESIRQKQTRPKDLGKMLDKIHTTVSGIKIMLSHKVDRGHV